MGAIVQWLAYSLVLPFLGIGMRIDLFQSRHYIRQQYPKRLGYSKKTVFFFSRFGIFSATSTLFWEVLSPIRTPLLSLPACKHHMRVCLVLSPVWLIATPWTAARQAPLSMGSPRQNTGVGCRFLLQRIFLTQGLNLHFMCFLRRWVDPLPLLHLESP